VVKGGSSRYVETLTASFRDRIRIRTPVRSVRRHPDRVELDLASGESERFDLAVLAAHADQSLAMLADPSDAERDILGAIPYQENRTVLHTDITLLPRRRPAWSSWNYTIPSQEKRRVAVTYLMNRLQSLDSSTQYCVTLNREDEIDPEQVIERLTYHHPVYTSATFAAQERHEELNGVNRTYYCGAYWGYGFHEDGVRSALQVARHFGKTL
jgi:predicted NAD/FAD-binding protein